MRLDPVFDSFYALSSLWSAVAGPQVCGPGAFAAPRVASETAVAQRPPAGPGVTAFINVSVIPMDSERVLRGQTVLVEGGKITALGPSSQVQVPAKAMRIDGRGKYLMPGLADMHVHDLEHGDIRGDTQADIADLAFTFLSDGVTTVRHMHEHYRISQAQWDMIRKGEVLSPRVYATGMQIGIPASIGVPQKWAPADGDVQDIDGKLLTDPKTAAAKLAAAKAAGFDIIHIATKDVYARKDFPMIDSLLAASRRLGVKLSGHDHDRSFGKVMDVGRFGGAIEHLEWLRDTLGLPVENYSDPIGEAGMKAMAAKLPALAAIAARSGVWITPTLNCLEMRYVMSADQRILLRQMTKALHDAGVKMFLSGDDHKNVHSELVALVRVGFTPYEALLTGTRNVAEFFNLTDSSGTVAAGKWADLILLDGNPLRDVRHTRYPAGVMVRGEWLDRQALDRGLLALPRTSKAESWVRRSVLTSGVNPQPNREVQTPKLRDRVTNFEDWSDSLAVAVARGPAGAQDAQRIRKVLMGEFKAMRKILRPEQYETFDLLVRLWTREQDRQIRALKVAH